MNIAIIGTGKVGRTLGLRWAGHGHHVVFGSRDPTSEKAQKLLKTAGAGVEVKSVREAAGEADAVVIAVPWNAAQTAVREADDLAGKILIDCTNPIAPGLQLALGTTTSGAEKIASWADGARVVKAFNATGWENMADPVYDGEPTLMPICGNDPEARALVLELAELLGFEVVDLGPLESARLLEPFALVWIHLARVQGLGPDIAFKLARR